MPKRENLPHFWKAVTALLILAKRHPNINTKGIIPQLSKDISSLAKDNRASNKESEKLKNQRKKERKQRNKAGNIESQHHRKEAAQRQAIHAKKRPKIVVKPEKERRRELEKNRKDAQQFGGNKLVIESDKNVTVLPTEEIYRSPQVSSREKQVKTTSQKKRSQKKKSKKIRSIF